MSLHTVGLNMDSIFSIGIKTFTYPTDHCNENALVYLLVWDAGWFVKLVTLADLTAFLS